MTLRHSVLVVEDEQSFIDALEIGLPREGFKVTVARDGPEALRMFDAVRPDLVLLDLNMPELDGFAVLQQIRKLVPAGEFLPVLALTGYNAAETRSKAIAAGASDFLGKPFDNVEVMLRIRNLLQTRFLYKNARQPQA
jgi:DNA-binding response OmpR family regulator